MIRHSVASFVLGFVAIALMYGLYVILPSYVTGQYKRSTLVSIILPQVSPSPTPSPTPGLMPATLIIPKLKIQAAVEPVGVTETGNMDVPKNAADVAWYSYGVWPSQEGNAVIAGHYDTPTGAPAIFYRLRTLKVGDEVEVISENAIHSVFEVSEVSTIPYDKMPNEEIFKSKPGKNLNLITCGGIWDMTKKTYTDRIVVYTTLKAAE